jgi:hypothetical protein
MEKREMKIENTNEKNSFPCWLEIKLTHIFYSKHKQSTLMQKFQESVAQIYGIQTKNVKECIERCSKKMGLTEKQVAQVLQDSFPVEHLKEIPFELRHLIAQGVSVKDILAWCETSKEHAKMCQDPHLWMSLLRRDFPAEWFVDLDVAESKSAYRLLIKMKTLLGKARIIMVNAIMKYSFKTMKNQTAAAEKAAVPVKEAYIQSQNFYQPVLGRVLFRRVMIRENIIDREYFAEAVANYNNKMTKWLYKYMFGAVCYQILMTEKERGLELVQTFISGICELSPWGMIFPSVAAQVIAFMSAEPDVSSVPSHLKRALKYLVGRMTKEDTRHHLEPHTKGNELFEYIQYLLERRVAGVLTHHKHCECEECGTISHYLEFKHGGCNCDLCSFRLGEDDGWDGEPGEGIGGDE